MPVPACTQEPGSGGTGCETPLARAAGDTSGAACATPWWQQRDHYETGLPKMSKPSGSRLNQERSLALAASWPGGAALVAQGGVAVTHCWVPSYAPGSPSPQGPAPGQPAWGVLQHPHSTPTHSRAVHATAGGPGLWVPAQAGLHPDPKSSPHLDPTVTPMLPPTLTVPNPNVGPNPDPTP